METVFLACFVFGALFTVASFVLGVAGHGAGHFGHGHDPAHAGHPDSGDGLPLFSTSALLAALTWFGAAGYALERLGDWALPAILLGALAAGAVGWYLVIRFLRLILSGEREMNPEDYRLVGTVGQITARVPAGGTGEVVFSMGGARRSEAARATGGAAIPRGTEVVITSYEDGFATVEPWSEFVATHDDVAALENKQA